MEASWEPITLKKFDCQSPPFLKTSILHLFLSVCPCPPFLFSASKFFYPGPAPWDQRLMLPGGTFAAAFAIDPLFHQTSAQFDAGGAKGMLLHNLSVYRRCEIVFDSEDVPDAAAGREMGKGEEEEGEEE